MTHRQLLQKLDIDPDNAASGDFLYNLPAFSLEHVLNRLGPSQRTDKTVGNRVVLTYATDPGGTLVIAGRNVDGTLKHGLIFIQHGPKRRA